MRLDFPLPVRPHIATFSPSRIVKFTSRNASAGGLPSVGVLFHGGLAGTFECAVENHYL